MATVLCVHAYFVYVVYVVVSEMWRRYCLHTMNNGVGGNGKALEIAYRAISTTLRQRYRVRRRFCYAICCGIVVLMPLIASCL
jgi:hypothetical protein